MRQLKMNVFSTIVTLLLLGALAFQDFRERKISWFLLPLLFFSLVFSAVNALPVKELAFYFSVNFSFILLQVAVLTIYFSIRKKKITHIANHYIGMGDLLFFVVICAAFSPVNFIIFYCASLVVSLLSILLFYLIARRQIKEIPLAGIFSVVLMLLLIYPAFFGNLREAWVNNFYNDQLVVSIFL